ncbi:MAG: hypothetical protein M3Q09_06160, partial [Gemmatimonadota bacterium]|nr:hypothetical protein [Gemmatimonadota bacterium]
MSPLSSTTSGAAGASRSQPHVQLSQEILERLREGLATCRSTRGITPEARSGIAVASRYARNQGWTPEQFIVAVKELC